MGKQHHSLAWKGILGASDIILKGMRWVVGDGKDILFWTHNWFFPHPIFHLIPENQFHSIQRDTKVAEFLSNGQWDRNKLNIILDNDIVDKICDIPFPLNNAKDTVVWGPSTNGRFSVKSATWIQR